MSARKVVLVVDDTDDNRVMLDRALRHLGYDVLLSGSGDHGFAQAVEHGPDLVLLDLLLPGVDGFAVLRDLRGHPATCDIPVAAVTRLAHPEVARHLGNFGFRSYLQRPFRLDALREVVERCLQPADAPAWIEPPLAPSA